MGEITPKNEGNVGSHGVLYSLDLRPDDGEKKH